MTELELMLECAGEECLEVAQRISKAKRFGLEEIQSGQELTNAERIKYELNDLLAMIFMLQERGIFGDAGFSDPIAMAKKDKKYAEYRAYSIHRGTVIPD